MADDLVAYCVPRAPHRRLGESIRTRTDYAERTQYGWVAFGSAITELIKQSAIKVVAMRLLSKKPENFGGSARRLGESDLRGWWRSI